jgi:hypothetical protein
MPVSLVFKTRIRMLRASKLEVLGVPDAIIAQHIGLTPAGLATMKQSDEYKRLQLTAATKVLSKDDEDLAEATETLRQIIRESVPTALQTMAELIEQRVDPKLAFQACESILDRDGRFMKASRTVVTPEDTLPSYMSSKDDDAVSRIVASQQISNTSGDKDKNGKKETIQ